MNALIVLAHPNPQSFNHAVALAVKDELEKNGAKVEFKDLYQMGWNPCLNQADFKGYHDGNLPEDVITEQAAVKVADLIVMVAPVWWTSVPAIMKGYMDRVFSVGFAYEYTPTGPRGKLGGKKGVFITSSGADEAGANANGMTAALKRTLVDGFFGFCGFSQYRHKNLFAVTIVKDEDRRQMLEDVRKFIRESM
ncbi:MAG TPA: NAD(P)H-dependent oxidoreductase [Syntrophomonas sp.]|nr:NAD(P)H-dependent oxidoreductase [Syntrophomonas sp.]